MCVYQKAGLCPRIMGSANQRRGRRRCALHSSKRILVSTRCVFRQPRHVKCNFLGGRVMDVRWQKDLETQLASTHLLYAFYFPTFAFWLIFTLLRFMLYSLAFCLRTAIGFVRIF